MIVYTDVHKSFGAQDVIKGVSITVAKGSVHFIIGKSGAGKSVLIKQVVGLLVPDAGSITFDGIELMGMSESDFYAIRRRCQMIFQHATLFDSLTAIDNVAMPLRKRFGCSKQQAQELAYGALQSVHAERIAMAMPSELGSGVQKRVAIARALALKPEALLYDEPTTSLDPVAARRIDRLIRETTDRFHLTSVVVSHDLASVRAIGDRVTYLHEGRVYFDGSPKELFAGDDPVIRDFVRGERQRWSADAVL